MTMQASNRRWKLAVRQVATQALIPVQFDSDHFPSEAEQAREAVAALSAADLPAIPKDQSMHDVLTDRGYRIVWIEEITGSRVQK
jgi:hypothetical protein